MHVVWTAGKIRITSWAKGVQTMRTCAQDASRKPLQSIKNASNHLNTNITGSQSFQSPSKRNARPQKLVTINQLFHSQNSVYLSP
mmetsp:Transcript_33302/g.53721  ORF Transcript_33302/g.53721 Transcript_33302/m.53721 type:complete len:85 (-) Transcript_33302:2454-2708(-)